MIDREKVIKGLEQCKEGGSCDGCEYDIQSSKCIFMLHADVLALLKKQEPKQACWVLDENPHDGDCRCSNCLIAIDAMHERNHPLLNALTGGRWWTFYEYCPHCGAKMEGR